MTTYVNIKLIFTSRYFRAYIYLYCISLSQGSNSGCDLISHYYKDEANIRNKMIQPATKWWRRSTDAEGSQPAFEKIALCHQWRQTGRHPYTQAKQHACLCKPTIPYCTTLMAAGESCMSQMGIFPALQRPVALTATTHNYVYTYQIIVFPNCP